MQLADLGHLIEGVVERDPMDECLRIRTLDDSGNQIFIDPIQLLEGFVGQEVKLTLASLDNLRKVQEALGGGDISVSAVMPEDIDGVVVRTTHKP